MILECQFVKLDPRAKLPIIGSKDSIGMDLYVLEDFGINPGHFRLIDTGLIAIPPVGFHYEILLRSSTGKKYNGLILANHVGLIDPTYCGPEDQLKLAFYNSSVEYHFVKCEKPLAQIVVRQSIKGEPQEISLEQYQTYGCARHSRGGFGSTDKK